MTDEKPARRAPLVTPILLKRSPRYRWPEGERMHYLLARDGLYRCRDEEFFRSCVKTPDGSGELEPQRPFFEPRFPLIPRALFEQVVGFFERAAELYGSEAAALFVWDRAEERVRLIVPEQTATMYESWDGYASPVGVHYELPTDWPAEWVCFGDIHSHVDQPAYASSVDKTDECHSAGLHLVVGRIQREPPEPHAEAGGDGERFLLDPPPLVEG